MPRRRKSANDIPAITNEPLVVVEEVEVSRDEAIKAVNKSDANICNKENVQGFPKMIVEFNGKKYPKITFENAETLRPADLRRLPVWAYRELQKLRTSIVHSKDRG